MPDKPRIAVDVIFNSRDARDFANKFGSLLSDTAKGWRDDVKKMTGDGVFAGMKIALASGKSGAAVKSFLKTNIADVYGQFMRELRAGNIEEAEKMERLLDRRVKRMQKEADAISSAFKDMQDRQARTFEEHADAFGNKVETLQRGMFGGLSGFTELLKGAGNSAQSFGRERQGRAGRMRELAQKEGRPGDVKGADRMAQMGKTIASLGKAAVGLAAVAGVVLLLAKMFADLESKIKDMNKVMLESAGAADFGFGSAEVLGGKLRDQLKAMRSETTALNSNFMRFKATAEEQQKILSQFNQAGFTYRKMNEEIEKGAKHMKNFSDITAVALTYSRNLGVDSGEIASKMGEFSLETGASLTDIAQQFSQISKEALVAGFMTKRFFSTIVEVSSGLNFYGVRLEETSKLLKTFDLLLGEAAGGEALKQITGQAKDRGAQDNIRDFIVKDQKFVTQQFTRSYEQRLRQLQRDFGTELKDINLEKLIKNAGSAAELRKQLAQMGIRGQKATDLVQLKRLQQSSTGNLAAQVGSRNAAGPGFEIAMALKAALPLQGFGETIGDVFNRAIETENVAVIAALESLESKAGVSRDGAIAMAEAAQATLLELREIKKDKDVPDALRKLGFFIDDQSGQIKRGLHDAAGNLSRDNATVIEDVFDVVGSHPTEGEKNLEAQLSRDQQIATEISSNITGLTEIMEQSVVGVLNNIYSVIRVIADLMPGQDTEKARLEAIDQAKADREEASRALEKAQQAVDAAKKLELEKPSLGATTGRVFAEEKLKEADKKLRLAQGSQEALEGLSSMDIEDKGAFKAAALAANPALAEGHRSARQLGKVQGFLGGTGDDALRGTSHNLSKATSVFSSDGENAAALKEKVMADLEKRGKLEEVTEMVGGKENLQTALDAAGKAYVDSEGNIRDFIQVLQSTAGSFAGQVTPEVQARWAEEDTQAKASLAELQKIADSVAQGAQASVMDLFGFGKKTHNDVILPAGGGPPVVPDEKDTLMAMKPDGPIARGLGGGGGGGGGTININIHGGDTKKIYDTVNRVLKARNLG